MPAINLIDPSLKNFDRTILSIQVSLDGFSFCIRSKEDRVLRAFRYYNFPHVALQEDILNKCHEILQKDELLRLPQDQVRVCYFSRKSTIVPAAYCKSDGYKKILEFNQPIDELDEIHSNPLPECEANLVFTVPTYFAGLISSKFGKVCYINQAAPLIQKSLRISETQSRFISIQLNREFFDIVVIEEGKLKLYNSFLFVSATDLLYFILYVCKQLDIKLSKTPILLCGEHVEDEKLINELKPYLSSRKSLTQDSGEQRSEALKKLDRSRFFTLLNLDACE